MSLNDVSGANIVLGAKKQQEILSTGGVTAFSRVRRNGVLGASQNPGI